MKPIMTKEEARAWRERWRVVNEITLAEARALSTEERLIELATLFDFAHRISSPCDPSRQAGVDFARARWRRLRDHFGE